MQKILNYLQNLKESDLQNFLAKAKTDLKIKRNVDQVIADTSWIDMIEDAIPYLDNIIRNPRRFIVQEENIVPIAKAKVVTEESIRHLAQHTSLIQEVKEDGSIIPEKLLNVYREETTDLYENRFIKSLVDNLYVFVTNKLNESDQKSFAKIKNTVFYQGQYNSKYENVQINLTLESDYSDFVNKSKNGQSLEDRIKHIQSVIAAFKTSSFIKNLKEASPVRSPIRKTNVILKEPNFIKALELWEYLEKNNIKQFTTRKNYTQDIDSEDIKNRYDTSFYIDCEALKEETDSSKTVNQDLNKVIYDYVFNQDIKEAEFKKMVMREYKEALMKKNKIKIDLQNKFNNFINSYEKDKKKAINLLK